jgi:hypothetical protein
MFGWFQGPFWLRTPTSSIRWKTREALALPGPRNLLAGIPEPGNSKVRKIWNATKNRWLTLENYSGLVGLFWVNCPGFINVIGCYIQIIPVNLSGIILSKYNDLIVLSGMIEYDSKGRLSQKISSQTFQVNELEFIQMFQLMSGILHLELWVWSLWCRDFLDFLSSQKVIRKMRLHFTIYFVLKGSMQHQDDQISIDKGINTKIYVSLNNKGTSSASKRMRFQLEGGRYTCKALLGLYPNVWTLSP